MTSVPPSPSRPRHRTSAEGPRYAPAPGTPPPSYSSADWEEDCMAMFGEGRDPDSCPECGRSGFYGPRIDATERHYRQCRFCGFTQMVGEVPSRYRPTVHSCPQWPECARAPYIWWVPPEVESYLCPFCSKRVAVADAAISPPAEDSAHPWWKVPQNRTRAYYQRFWENWDVTKGRVHL